MSSVEVGEDYITQNTILGFDDTSGEGTEVCLNITIIDDDVLESNHSFTVFIVGAISMMSTSIEVNNESATIEIIDNDGKQTHFCLYGLL